MKSMTLIVGKNEEQHTFSDDTLNRCGLKEMQKAIRVSVVTVQDPYYCSAYRFPNGHLVYKDIKPEILNS